MAKTALSMNITLRKGIKMFRYIRLHDYALRKSFENLRDNKCQRTHVYFQLKSVIL